MVLIVAFSSLITLFLTAFQLFLDYRQQRGDMERVLDDVTVQIPTLSNVVWAFNEKQIELSLEALIRLPNIDRAQIVTPDGQGHWSRAADQQSSHFVTRTYSLHRDVRGEERNLGTLEVVARLDGIYQRVFEHALSILLSNAVKTFLVAAFMLFIFNHYVTRRVVDLAHDVGSLAPRLLDVPMPARILPTELPAGSDELDAVRWSFDAMAKQLEAALAALKDHTEHLEETVQQRTADLEREKMNLAQALGELQKILEHASIGICLVVPSQGQGHIFLRVNKAFEDILGYRSGELDGADTRIIFQNDEDYERISASYEHTIPQGLSFHGEVTYQRKDGQPVFAEVVGAAVAPGDLSKGTIWLLNDITQRKSTENTLAAAKDEAESGLVKLSQAHAELNDTLIKLRTTQDELVEREKLAALGSLVAGVAHELNTPIGNSLMGASTLHDKTIEFRKQLKEGIRRSTLESYVEIAGHASELVMRNLHRAAELVSSFKQVAVDQTSSQRRRFNLKSMVSEFIFMLQPSIKKTRFVVEHAIPDDIEMNSFPGPLGQVISNLINNAFVHGFDGYPDGRVRIEARLVGDAWVELTVNDNGVGVPTENLSHIFEPFFTTKLGHGGSGLGLNIVRTIITGLMGGQITVNSEPGLGTTFVLRLPINAPDKVG